jgi:hypothetical protein
MTCSLGLNLHYECSTLWRYLNRNERARLREECRQAIVIHRRLRIYLQGSGKAQCAVLEDRATNQATLVDFEHYGMCTETGL